MTNAVGRLILVLTFVSHVAIENIQATKDMGLC